MKVHVLDGDGVRFQVVFHRAVPAAANVIGVNYRQALVNSGLGGASVLAEGTGPGQIASAELAQIRAGEVLEVTHEIATSGGGMANVDAYLDATHSSVTDHCLAELERRLRFFGATRA